ncbi:MAG: DoxX family protein [Bacteroidota bacterium]|nr:DoxX family protein [Bacteroidota bacterium]
MKEADITEKTSAGHPLWLTILRIALGFILFWKGINFIRDTSLLQSMIEKAGIGMLDKNSSVLAFIITYLNLLGGLFIAVGLFTKTSSIIQIPILIGAVFLVNMRQEGSTGFELVLSIIVLVLLVVFAFKGSSSISADEYFRSYYKAGSEEGNTRKFFK